MRKAKELTIEIEKSHYEFLMEALTHAVELNPIACCCGSSADFLGAFSNLSEEARYAFSMGEVTPSELILKILGSDLSLVLVSIFKGKVSETHSLGSPCIPVSKALEMIGMLKKVGIIIVSESA